MCLQQWFPCCSICIYNTLHITSEMHIASWGEPERGQRSVVRLVYSCSQMQPMHLVLVELQHAHVSYTYTQCVRKILEQRFCAYVIVELEHEYIRNVNVCTQTDKIPVDSIMWVSLRLATIIYSFSETFLCC